MLIKKFLESDNIKRFWALPLIFSLFLFHSQLFDMLLGIVATKYLFGFSDTEINVIIRQINYVAIFRPYILAGIAAGLCFASLDFRKNEVHDPSGNEATTSTIRNLIPSGALSWLIWLILKTTITYAMASPRYHAYPPEMQWLNIFALIFPLLLTLALLWTVFKTLNRYKNLTN